MWNSFVKLVSLCLLTSITFTFPVLQSEGQYPDPGGPAEITFFGKEETKWVEKREVALPANLVQGTKEEPRVDSFDLREESLGPTKKMSASTTQPGCAYSSRFTSGLAKAFTGDKALYEKGRYRYLKGAYEDAVASFEKLIQDYPRSEWAGSSHYWIGETRYHQGKDEGAFSYFHKVVEIYPDSEFYIYALYSCGWIRLKHGVYEEGHPFFHRAYEKAPAHPVAESSLFWSGYCLYQAGRYAETLLQKYPAGKWRP